MAFYTPIMNYQKGKLRKQSHLHLHQKNKIPRNKINQGGKRPVLRKLRHWRKILKKIQISGSTYHIHGQEDLTLLNVNTTQSNLYTQHNSYQDTNGISHSTRKNIPNIYMEPQNTLNTHSNLEKEEQSWTNHVIWYQTLLQGHNQNNMLLA